MYEKCSLFTESSAAVKATAASASAATTVTVSSGSTAPTESADSADRLKNLTSQGVQESLLKAQKLGQAENKDKVTTTTGRYYLQSAMLYGRRHYYDIVSA